jgi:hypothetical protein
VPCGLRRVSLLEGSSSCILKRCPRHLNLAIFTTLTVSNTELLLLAEGETHETVKNFATFPRHPPRIAHCHPGLNARPLDERPASYLLSYAWPRLIQ